MYLWTARVRVSQLDAVWNIWGSTMKISDHHHHCHNDHYHPYHPDLGRGLQTQLEDVARGEAPVNVRVGLQRVEIHVPKYF